MPNLPEMLIAHFAVPLAGGVLVAMNTRLVAEEMVGALKGGSEASRSTRHRPAAILLGASTAATPGSRASAVR